MSLKSPGDAPVGLSGEIAVEGHGDLVAARGASGIKAEAGFPDLGKVAKEAASGVAVEVGQAVAGAVEKAIGGVAGKVTGVVAGSVAGVAVKAATDVLKGAPKANLVEELPVFEEIAVTSSPAKTMQGAVAKMKEVVSGALGGVARALGGKNFEVEVGSGDKLDVRQFSIHERLSSLFQVNLIAVSENPSIEFDDVVGQPAKFSMAAGKHDRFWSGVCNHFEQVRVEPTGLSTYQFSIVPTLWLLTQRKNHRMFQQISEPDIVLKLLKEWDIEPVLRIDKGAYKKRKYRVQYSESDFTFMSRMLEDAGITLYFEQAGDETKLVLSDAPQANASRGASLTFMDDTSMIKDVNLEFVTGVRMGQRVRPGKYTMRDHDYRKPPAYKLMSSASKGLPVEEKLERFQYTPGAFLFGSDSGEATPSADDKGKARTDEKEAAVLAQKRLDAKRGSARVATFETNAHDLSPGVVMAMSGHPHAALGDGKSFLVVESSMSGTTRGEWSHHCEVRGTDVPFRPELATPRPKVNGVESATVVGPAGEEIHTDEFGRVRAHFHWDRESKMDDNSSCWIHVSQPWGGAGYGGTALPRIGQEVLVDFLGGDPDRPVIVGRVYTNLQKTPYKLPENKTQSGLKSNSTGGGGGYNELMFEDAVGKELVRMQAEKDLNKLVKHDEQVAIGNDRTKQVGHDDALTVGHDRSKVIGNDEAVTVGHDRVSMMGHDEAVTVGHDETKAVLNCKREMVGMHRSRVVGINETVDIGNDQTVAIGGSQATTVAKCSTETVGLEKTVTVGAAHQLIVGATMMTTVGAAMITAVGASSAEEVGAVKTVNVGQSVEIVCGASKITLDKSGKILISGTEIDLTSDGPININGQAITVNGTEIVITSDGPAELHGATVKITGDPIDLN